jgi:hypothetical protein
MFTYARTRRAALLFLLLAVSLVGTVGPASAKLIPAPYPIADPDAGGPQPQGNHTDVAVSSDAGLLPWVLIGLAVALVAAGVVMVALRRHGRTHQAALTS